MIFWVRYLKIKFFLITQKIFFNYVAGGTPRQRHIVLFGTQMRQMNFKKELTQI